jgi:hypothetical protein
MGHSFARRADTVDDRLIAGTAPGVDDPLAQNADSAAVSPFSGVPVGRPTLPFLLAWHRHGIGFRKRSGFVDFLEIDGDFGKSLFLSGLSQEIIHPRNC